MLWSISDRSEIRAVRDRWLQISRQLASETVQVKLGWQGGEALVQAYWFSTHGFWVAHEQDHNRWWNPLGLSRPTLTSSPNIVVEINPAFGGVNRRIAGRFAKNRDGQNFLVHSGNIGGGKPGVGKRYFYERYGGPTDYIDGWDEEVAMVGRLCSPSFLDDVAAFVAQVGDMKLRL